jgi:hypothetical protein
MADGNPYTFLEQMDNYRLKTGVNTSRTQGYKIG